MVYCVRSVSFGLVNVYRLGGCYYVSNTMVNFEVEFLQLQPGSLDLSVVANLFSMLNQTRSKLTFGVILNANSTKY